MQTSQGSADDWLPDRLSLEMDAGAVSRRDRRAALPQVYVPQLSLLIVETRNVH